MKKKILVAGGTGYIGSHTSVELINAGYEVVIIDDLSNSNIEVLDGIEKITGVRPAFVQLDLKDKEGTRKALEAHTGINGIILFAASKAVGESVQMPLKYYRNNIVTLLNLLELMPEFGIEGIVFSSSCTVYGQPTPENLPVTENAPIQPALSPYGNTKQINEEIIRDTIHAGAPFNALRRFLWDGPLDARFRRQGDKQQRPGISNSSHYPHYTPDLHRLQDVSVNYFYFFAGQFLI